MNQDSPSGWIHTTIGEVTTNVQQRQPLPEEQFFYIDISSVDRNTKRIINPKSITGIDAPSRARQVVATGDVLVSMTRPNLNAVAMVPAELDAQVASTGFDVLRSVGIDARWLYYLVRTENFISTMSSLVQGALYPAVRPKDIRNFQIPLAPLKEQKRIDDKLDVLLTRVDACQVHLERVTRILKRFRQAVLATAVSGRLTEDWRYKNGHGLSEWSNTTLGDLIEDIEAGINVQCEERPPEQYERGLVKISAITWGEYNDDESKTLPLGKDVPEFTRIKVGDFLISRANTIELVGACVIVEKVKRPIYLSDKVLRLVLPDDLKKWVLYWLRSNAGRKQIESLASGNQLSMRNISQANLRIVRVKLPPADERGEIVHRIETLFAFAKRTEARLQAAHLAVDRLTSALLTKAFRGELVPQDPNEESVSVLLERIRKVREAAEEELPIRKSSSKKKERPLIEVSMLRRSEITNNHLSAILKERGSLTAEALWSASQLYIDDFYDQLKDEEDRQFLHEIRNPDPYAPRLLEAL